jgi:hypothetical protein
VEDADAGGISLALTGKPALLLNLARTRTPAAYLHLLWSSVVVLNEAYPAPPRSVLEQFAARDCRFYHLAGAATREVGESGPANRRSHGLSITAVQAAAANE